MGRWVSLVWAAAAAAALAACGCAERRGRVHGYEGDDRPVAAADLLLEPADVEAYTEGYEFLLFLDEGTTARIRFVVTNLGLGDNHGGFEFRAVQADGTKTGLRLQLDDGEWSSEPGRLALTLAGARLEADLAGARILLAAPQAGFDLRLTNEMPPWRPGGGVLTFRAEGSDDTLTASIEAMAPRARVRGRLRLAGRERAVSGLAFGAHTRSTIAPHKMASRWTHLQAMAPSHTVAFIAFDAPAEYGGGSIGWVLLAEGGRIIFRSVDLALESGDLRRDPASGYDVPWSWRLRARDGEATLAGEIVAQRLFDVVDVLAGLSPLMRAVVERFAAPYIFDQECTYRLELRWGGGAPRRFEGTTRGCGTTKVR